MGSPSPAQDFAEQRISLDQRIITRSAATYFMRVGVTHYHESILSGVLFVMDASLRPCDGSLLTCGMEGEFRIERYRKLPKPHLEDLQTGKREGIPVHDDGTSPDMIFGVITHNINDMRPGGFDDCPVMQWGIYGTRNNTRSKVSPGDWRFTRL